MRTHTVHFSVRGADLTRIVRQTMLSDLPGKAYRILTVGLRGDGIERAAPDICDGNLKLVGDESTMRCVKTGRSANSYKKQLRFIYAGRVRIERSWWRPKARVSLFGRDDAEFAMTLRNHTDIPESAPEALKAMRRFAQDRVAFYAARGEQAVAVGNKIVIFEAVSEPPFWWPEHQDVEAALADFLATGHVLDERNHEPERFRGAYAEELRDEAAALDELAGRGSPDEDASIEDAWRGKTTTRADRLRERAAMREEFEASMGLKDAEDDHDHQREACLADLRTKILAQTAGDMMELKAEDGVVVAIVARAPFINWALWRCKTLKHMAPPWECVSPQGLKMQLDDPYHTDWWLSTGLDLGEAYERGPIKDAADRTMFELQHALGNFECAVLVDGPDVTGVIGKDIVVLPDLHPDRLDTLLTAKACITEVGGKLAHLAQVALEQHIPMLLVPDARARFVDGLEVTVYPSEGRVRIHREFA